MLESKHLEKALHIAVNAHYEQVDKAFEPYIFHPLRVMNSVDTLEEKIVAILHDVVEDTPVSIKDLDALGFPASVLNALELLTHDEAMSYDEYIAQIATNPIARKVKLADLKDNSNLSRLSAVTTKDLERVEKYKKAIESLLSV